MLTGGYFGLAPPPGSLLAELWVLRLSDFGTMMQLSVLVGVAHIALANPGSAWYRRWHAAALAPLGWVLLVLGATVLWLGTTRSLSSGPPIPTASSPPSGAGTKR